MTCEVLATASLLDLDAVFLLDDLHHLDVISPLAQFFPRLVKPLRRQRD